METENHLKKSCIFYKLIHVLQLKKLRIPEKFVKKYGSELGPMVILNASDGRSWVVELKRVYCKLWFQDGWNEFMEHYSIGDGYFLVFSYQGNSTFGVHIYDLKDSEIKYPPSNLQEPSHDVQIKKNDSEQVIVCSTRGKSTASLAGANQCLITVGIQLDGSKRVHTAEKTGLDKFTERRIKKQKQSINENDSLENHRVEEKSLATLTRRWREVTKEEKRQVIQAAAKFKSSNPFCRVVMRPSYVFKGMLLHLPTDFGRAHLNGVTRDITLQLSDGKKWQVRYVWHDPNGGNLSRGWSWFVLDNNLDEGDVCIFELIPTNETVLQVTIFRVIEEQHDPSK